MIDDDKEYCDEIEKFISGNQDIHYHYIYPSDSEDVSRQVSHYAPTNIDGYRPVYIDMWTKLSKSWDIDGIKKSVRILANDFLDLNIKVLRCLMFQRMKKQNYRMNKIISLSYRKVD
ncbi:hypothetical protein [Paenibacillus sp. N3.4]|uniref:hypothetical protein n=1 Tax=Paenibacillus sp. N3.4 TaxID=2603222 RepID=UPI0011CB1788|nr:hypothetical protein [Paenibacillus sp. N3.4]TXK84914.1 hypothetical protein FU659_06470 [Paenibacillus sp. N3.4]